MYLSDREIFVALISNDKLKPSDAIILLEGDGLNRCEKAIQLYKDKWARKIVFSGGIHQLSSGSYPFNYFLDQFACSDVPKDDITIEEKSRNTKEQAYEVLKIAFERGWSRLILVASHYHQYRAYLTFLQEVINNNYKIEIINAPSSQLTWFEELPWGRRFDLLTEEFHKIEEYANKGHVASFSSAIEYQKWKEQQI